MNQKRNGMPVGSGQFRDDSCEVIFGANNEHRADILGADRTVIEIQHSRIDIRDVQDRVDFYAQETARRVVWVVDVSDFWRKTLHLGPRDPQNNAYRVEWKPKRTWLHYLAQTTATRLYLEYRYDDDKMLHAWVHEGVMWARFESKIRFFEKYLRAVAKPEFQATPGLFLEGFRQ